MSKSIKITMNDDGTFRLETEGEQYKDYSEQHLVLALEDTVLHFRGKKVRLTTLNTAPPTGVSTTQEAPAGDTEATSRYNGGLGPTIGGGQDGLVNGGLGAGPDNGLGGL
jgi:hypothetical protein